MKTIEVTVTYKYEIRIEENNPIVKEYESENDLLVDCANYRFSDVLPVIKTGGLVVRNEELIAVS
jgi:hypothetical protein